jgi:hypothetical protein
MMNSRIASRSLTAALVRSTLVSTIAMCAPQVIWHDQAVIGNGEIRPGYGTPEIWQLKLH